MSFFNAIQLTILFIAWPWIVQWLHTETFAGASVLCIAAGCCYALQIGVTVYLYSDAMERR